MANPGGDDEIFDHLIAIVVLDVATCGQTIVDAAKVTIFVVHTRIGRADVLALGLVVRGPRSRFGWRTSTSRSGSTASDSASSW